MGWILAGLVYGQWVYLILSCRVCGITLLWRSGLSSNTSSGYSVGTVTASSQEDSAGDNHCQCTKSYIVPLPNLYSSTARGMGRNPFCCIGGNGGSRGISFVILPARYMKNWMNARVRGAPIYTLQVQSGLWFGMTQSNELPISCWVEQPHQFDGMDTMSTKQILQHWNWCRNG